MGWKSLDRLQMFLGRDSSHLKGDVSIQPEELYLFSVTRLQRFIPLVPQGRATRMVQSLVTVGKKRYTTKKYVVSYCL